MNEPLQNLTEALREELKQYGEMIALLDQEQELLMHRQTAGLLQSVAAINSQAETLQAVRLEREQRRRHVARSLGLDEAIAFKDLTPHLGSNYRPLIQALVQENNELLVRIQQRARQNHLLLSRAVELMQRFIDSLLPGAGPATYTDAGRMLAGPAPHQAIYDAVG
jgi:flagellar biosynthesis/type III secretory pathway chaperone